MRRLKRPGIYVLILVLLVGCFLAFSWLLRWGSGGAAPPTVTSAISLTAIEGATEPGITGPGDTDPLDEQFAEIDEFLSQSVQSNIAYNVPERVALDETVTLELLLNPSLPPTQLAGEVTEPGTVVTAAVEITRISMVAQPMFWAMLSVVGTRTWPPSVRNLSAQSRQTRP